MLYESDLIIGQDRSGCRPFLVFILILHFDWQGKGRLAHMVVTLKYEMSVSERNSERIFKNGSEIRELRVITCLGLLSPQP